MPRLFDSQLCISQDFGSTVTPADGKVAQRGDHIECRQDTSGLLQAGRSIKHFLPQLQKEVVFQLFGSIVCRHDLLFILLQFRSDVAFGILEGLLTNKTLRDLVPMGRGDLQVVAKHLVETDFKVGNSRGLADLSLVAGNPLLTAACQLAKAVQFLVLARPNKASFTSHQRTLRFKCMVE